MKASFTTSNSHCAVRIEFLERDTTALVHIGQSRPTQQVIDAIDAKELSQFFADVAATLQKNQSSTTSSVRVSP